MCLVEQIRDIIFKLLLLLMLMLLSVSSFFLLSLSSNKIVISSVAKEQKQQQQQWNKIKTEIESWKIYDIIISFLISFIASLISWRRLKRNYKTDVIYKCLHIKFMLLVLWNFKLDMAHNSRDGEWSFKCEENWDFYFMNNSRPTKQKFII